MGRFVRVPLLIQTIKAVRASRVGMSVMVISALLVMKAERLAVMVWWTSAAF